MKPLYEKRIKNKNKKDKIKKQFMQLQQYLKIFYKPIMQLQHYLKIFYQPIIMISRVAKFNKI